jgi:hypothetical protein
MSDAVNKNDLTTKTIKELANVISRDWKNVNYGAVPYLQAMFTLNSVRDYYYADEGSGIVAYFLANANSWRGEVAKAVKKELNRRLKEFYGN